MKIRTQLILSMVFFGIALLIISASVILTHQQTEQLNKQEELARNIQLEAGELSYLSNDYLLYHESQQVDRWEAKFSSFSNDLSNLSVDRADQQVLVNNIKANRLRLREIFDDVVSKTEGTPALSESAADNAFIQVSGSRIGVQVQGVVFDATRLSQMLREQADQHKQRNIFLIFALMVVFIAFLLSNYILFYRGTLKSIANLQAGTMIIGSGNLDFSLEEKGNDEIGELSRAFNRMASDLKGITASKTDLEREILEKKLAEKALRTSEEQARDQSARLQAVLDSAPAIIWNAFDSECKNIAGNRAAFEFLRVSKGTDLSKTGSEPEQLAHYRIFKDGIELAPEDMPIQRVAKSGQGISNYSLDFHFDDGTVRSVMGNVTAIFNSKGLPSGAVAAFIDITELKQAEETLRLSEERYRSLFQGMTEGFAIHEILLDENGKPYDYRFLDINPAFERLTGLLREDVVGKTHNEVLPGDGPIWLEEYGAVALTGKPIRFDNYSPALGKHFEVFAYSPAKGYFATVFMDVTERKRQEEKIARLTRLYEVLSRVNEAIVRIRYPELLYKEVCRIVADVGGFPLVWIGQAKELQVVPVAWSGPATDYLEEIKVEVQGEFGKGPTGTCIRENRTVVNEDFGTNPAASPWRDQAKRHEFRASAAFPLCLHGTAIGAFTLYSTEAKAFDAEQVGLLESLSSDISYALDALDEEQLRIRADEGLRETHDYLENLIGYANAPIIVWDPNFRITRFNHAFERLTGMREAETLGKQLDILFPAETMDTSFDHIRRALSGEHWDAVEIPIQRADGSVRTVLWNSANIYNKEGITVVATIAQGQDITERKLAEEDLRKARDELEERVQQRTKELFRASEELAARAMELARKSEDLTRSNAELEQFAYVASHDLQEPLRMISSYVQLLSRRYSGKLDTDADEFIAYAVEGTKRMQQLINDLLAYSRVGTRGKPPSPTSFERVFCAALANLKIAVEESGAIVTHDELPNEIADEMQMVQLFQNLIGNAIKFRSHESPQIHVSARAGDDEWIFSVKDDGIGIDPQFFDRIFTIFQRLHGRNEYPGTGIGLTVSKKIVERHGGQIWLESEPGSGTTFYFTVPMQMRAETGANEGE